MSKKFFCIYCEMLLTYFCNNGKIYQCKNERKKVGKQMKDKQNQIIKIAGFYVDDWHLTAMILPHIHRTLEDKEEILTILERGIQNKIENLASKIHLTPQRYNKILAINWTSNKTCKYQQIKQEIEEKAKQSNNIQIIIKGTEEYINKANQNVEKILKNIEGKQIKIINCYEVEMQNEVNHILDKHDFVINTSGIKKIEEIFTDYKKEEQKKHG